MSDLVFKCSSCSMSLSVEDVYVGTSFACPGCQSQIEAPMPATVFFCNSCECRLCSPVDYLGTAFCCPNCENEMQVPDDIIICCPGCSTYLELDEEYLRAEGGHTAECPECAGPLEIPAIEFPEPVAPEPPQAWTPDDVGDQLSKTMKLDEILDFIPQSHNLEEGICPYCKNKLFKLHERAYVCKRCNRVIKKVKRGGH